MATRTFVVISVSVLIVAGLIAVLGLSTAQPLTGDETRQVVAAVAAESVTEYEPDPFEPQRVRSSTVRVRMVALVYTDGTVELKECQ